MTYFDLFRFYGIDWIAMIFQFLSIYALGIKSRSGFAFGVVGCAGWGAYGLMTGSVADIAANVICLVMNVLGYVRWADHGERYMPLYTFLPPLLPL